MYLSLIDRTKNWYMYHRYRTVIGKMKTFTRFEEGSYSSLFPLINKNVNISAMA